MDLFRDIANDWMRTARRDPGNEKNSVTKPCIECEGHIENAITNVCYACLERMLKDVEAFDS